MGPARIYPWRKMHRSRAPSIAPGTFFVAQFSAGYTTNMSGFDLRQGQRAYISRSGVDLPLVVRIAPEAAVTQSPYFHRQTIKDKRPRGHYTAWPLRDCPPRPSRDSVSWRMCAGGGVCLGCDWNYPQFRRRNTPQPTRPLQTASLATSRGDALTDLLAGLAANSIGSFVKGLIPLRASVAGLFTTDILTKPGMTNSPDSFSSL